MRLFVLFISSVIRMSQKSKQHAPKGQKPIAQGNTQGKSITNTNAPCKGKSVNYQCFCPCRAFCYFQSVHPRRCLGLCAFGAFSPLCLTFDTSSWNLLLFSILVLQCLFLFACQSAFHFFDIFCSWKIFRHNSTLHKHISDLSGAQHRNPTQPFCWSQQNGLLYYVQH